ncbi:helix-turn-helix transcriptional regulator [Rhodobacter sp. NTK016B]|uniref:AraC family transcriptional regulator n=1 Tax=Rhodobacter sp. NTK016B TaxID=2759676 RepID=UPI001A90657A|nr:AraC family transcriptional regulator [Rhodobacter sp. NTK016B]MBN8294147.1 helix-turn-helix transcriptional regulator [Rhodobacter sp. NTK016B]
MLFHRWHHTALQDEVATVMPDGCRDVLVLSRPDEEPVVSLTDWDDGPRRVSIRAGTTLTGYRLRPGVVMAEPLGALDAERLDQQIASALRVAGDSTDLITALAEAGEDVDALARQQGVSARTLQRHFAGLSLPPPRFWRLLGRARRAALALPGGGALSELALDHGYSDQAHMNREFLRWFGRTPGQLRSDPAALAELSQPGLGNWSAQLSGG